ncbi:polyribonucleotide nucleotidyltransferase [candidate division WOR-3 bacterium]|uniref:Polyribonucleotide nucleotidyltransferase n=1 Tax=candidate division WOR-3 bacterium TaxID=2052148 RepID=A0A938BTX8_UNCW3|nr:polyribonucleotide nucleotidyltransferase [candidate division WOR-3 bacterium]
MQRVEKEVCGRTLSLEHGQVARQSDGGVLARYGDTVILASAVYAKEPPKEYLDYFPLIVDYRVLAYAAGKIPGGFFKREGKPRDKETLTCRLIDRPIRPLFPANFRADTQIVEYLLSTDLENESEFLGLVAASAALHISEIPFQGPVGACRVGKFGDEFVLNPPMTRETEADMWMLYVGIGDQVMTIAGQAREVSPEDIDKGWELAQPVIKQTIELQEELRKLVGKPKLVNDKPNVPPELEAEIRRVAADRVKAIHDTVDKLARGNARSQLSRAVIAELAPKFPGSDKMIKEVLDEMFGEDMRRRVLETGVRLDGRNETEVRQIDCAVGVLPRAHGSALFTRGQTQSLAATTLGTRQDEQVIDDVELEVEERKSYMLHYNFPPFSVGEVKFLRGPGRREIGHGDLAERGLEAVIPRDENFPYTVRIVSDILESNGSSSMASVCAGSLSLMDAGVPVKAAVAGMAMGLITDGDISKGAKYRIVTDIMGDEDHYGYMDFKVAGTRKGITAIQLDLKLPGVPYSVLAEGIRRSTTARIGVLDIMDKTIDKPRPDLSKYAPRIVSIVIDKEKIGTVIGPGGKMIRKITEETGATIDIEDDGTVTIASNKVDSLNAAKAWVESLVEEVEVGKIYEGTVTRLMNFGAFVEVLPGKEGLVHISQLGPERYNRVEDAVREGDKVWVKVVEIDDMGRVNLSRRKAMEERGEIPPSDDSGIASRPPRRGGPPFRGGGDRRDRRGPRR